MLTDNKISSINTENEIMVMTKNDHKMTTNDHKMTTNEHTFFECQYCNKLFSTKPHMRRHQNYYCKEIEEHNPKIAIKRLKLKMEKDNSGSEDQNYNFLGQYFTPGNLVK